MKQVVARIICSRGQSPYDLSDVGFPSRFVEVRMVRCLLPVGPRSDHRATTPVKHTVTSARVSGRTEVLGKGGLVEPARDEI